MKGNTKGGSDYWLAKVSVGVVLRPPSWAKSTLYQIVKTTAAKFFGVDICITFLGPMPIIR